MYQHINMYQHVSNSIRASDGVSWYITLRGVGTDLGKSFLRDPIPLSMQREVRIVLSKR